MKSGNIFQQTKPQRSQSQSQSSRRFTVTDNPLEQLRSIPGGVKRGIGNDLLRSMGSTAANSVFNPRKLHAHEANSPYEHLQRRTHEQRPRKIERPREVFVYTAKEAQMQRKIEEVRAELKAMIQQLKDVSQEIEKTIETPISDGGVYYLNYLDRLKVVLKVLRKELGNSGTWAAMAQSRKKHRTYWAMYKKKGTKFGLSSEHKLTRQAG